MQITLAHPTPAPFVQQVGRALFEAGMLSQFATTFVARPDAKWLNNLSQLAKIFQIDLSKQLSRRSVTELPLSLVKDYPWHEIIHILFGLISRDEIVADLIFHWGNNAFDHWVARQAIIGSQAVYGYEYDCLATFQTAKQQGIACIYDVPSPEHDFVENLLQEELKIYPELQTPYRTYCQARQEPRTQRRRNEWQLADVVVANSEFTKASYAAAGLDVKKVRVVPLAAPPVCHEALAISNPQQEPVKFLWAGTFGIRKGAHYLLQAWKQLQHSSGASLDVLGAMELPSRMLENLPNSLNISRTVPRSELYEYYRRADVLVFPTLCDGFGLVVTEAFAQGLPVITTNRAGAADLVKHGVNGLIIPAGDVNALAEALDWCITHRLELKNMRQAALETAASWQWSDYRLALIENLRDGLIAAGYNL
jgi:glycosyltransferase involved in cell wall biosynthesis